MSFNAFVGMSSMEELAIFPDSTAPVDPLTRQLENSWAWVPPPSSVIQHDVSTSFEKLVTVGSNTSRAADGSVLAGNELARMLANGLALWSFRLSSRLEDQHLNISMWFVFFDIPDLSIDRQLTSVSYVSVWPHCCFYYGCEISSLPAQNLLDGTLDLP